MPVTKGKLVWTGENAASKRHGNILRLYSGVWKNPHPKKEVATIDMVGKHGTALLFCVGITAVVSEEAAEPVKNSDGEKGEGAKEAGGETEGSEENE